MVYAVILSSRFVTLTSVKQKNKRLLYVDKRKILLRHFNLSWYRSRSGLFYSVQMINQVDQRRLDRQRLVQPRHPGGN